jgi:hypothetical protein
MKKISYSQYSQYVACPHKWKLNYIDKLREFKGNLHTIFGSAMHDALQMYLTTMYNDTVKMADALPLDEMLLYRMKQYYIELMESNGGEIICEQHEMQEFYEHGLAILDWFKKKRGSYFSKRGYELVGIEVPIECKLGDGITFIGFMDVVIKDTLRDRYKIIDIKTSTMGWNKYMKADKNKTDQLLLYKQFFGKQNNIPLDKIDVEYFIVKRKLYEKVDFPQKRIQSFIPANGTPSINKVLTKLKSFITEAFSDGSYTTNILHPTPSKKSCKFCEFNATKHCNVGVK